VSFVTLYASFDGYLIDQAMVENSRFSVTVSTYPLAYRLQLICHISQNGSKYIRPTDMNMNINMIAMFHSHHAFVIYLLRHIPFHSSVFTAFIV